MKMLKRVCSCLLFGVLAFTGVFSGVLDAVDKSAEDVLYHRPGKIDAKIKIIKIDDRAMNRLGEFSAWERDIYADLVETLCVSEEIRPAVIGFDVLFSDVKNEESDTRFAQICEEQGNVVTGLSYVFSKKAFEDAQGNLHENKMFVEEKVTPYDSLQVATKQGFVNALMDEDDSIIRSSFLYFIEENGTKVKSFSSAVYEAYMEAIGESAGYPTEKSKMTFRYSGKPGEYENVSLVDVLDGTVPPEAFNDCIVLVGAYAQGFMDAYFVPVDRSAQMYGVEIHANVIQALLESKTLTRVPVVAEAVITALVMVVLVLFCERLSVGKIAVICCVLVILKITEGAVLFRSGYAGNVLVLPVMTVTVGIYTIGIQYYRARKAKQSIEKAFRKYVAPQVVKEIAKSGTYELKLGGENRDIAVLFVDIRGFTSLSEKISAEQVVEILNEYLALTTECVFRHGGTLDKFVGDATMAVFNAPFDTEDYVYKAVLTAWDIVRGGDRIEREFMERFGIPVGFGVGVNCGPAVVGNIGCEFRMDYTAIGDTVNTAARLEANAPHGTIYISETVYRQVKDRITVEEVGEIPLKGKAKGVFVYSVIGVDGEQSPKKE